MKVIWLYIFFFNILANEYHKNINELKIKIKAKSNSNNDIVNLAKYYAFETNEYNEALLALDEIKGPLEDKNAYLKKDIALIYLKASFDSEQKSIYTKKLLQYYQNLDYLSVDHQDILNINKYLIEYLDNNSMLAICNNESLCTDNKIGEVKFSRWHNLNTNTNYKYYKDKNQTKSMSLFFYKDYKTIGITEYKLCTSKNQKIYRNIGSRQITLTNHCYKNYKYWIAYYKQDNNYIISELLKNNLIYSDFGPFSAVNFTKVYNKFY